MTISRERAFSLDGDTPQPVDPETLLVPDGQRALICREISRFLDLELVAEDLRIDANRTFGALAIRDGRNPVIVEFRRDPNENLVERAEQDLQWVLENPQAVHYAIRRAMAFGNEIADRIAYDAPELLCIAVTFSEAEIELAREMAQAGEAIGLYRALRTYEDHLVFLPIDIRTDQSAEMGRMLRTQSQASSIASATNVSETVLQEWIAKCIQAEIREGLQRELREQLQALGFDTARISESNAADALEEPGFFEFSLEDLDLSHLDDLPSDTPRSTRFLHVLRAAYEQIYDQPIEQYPKKTTLRIPRPDLGAGCELVYGVRRHDARVEWYIPKNHANSALLRALDEFGDRYFAFGSAYERVEEDYAVRIFQFSTVPAGWDDLETLWPAVIDDLDDTMCVLEEAIGYFYSEAFGYDPTVQG